MAVRTRTMSQRDWRGVIPAITTPFLTGGDIDEGFFREHARWMLSFGCRGIVTPGSLGEGTTLSGEERRTLWRLTAAIGAERRAAGNDAHPIAAIAAASTSDAVKAARDAAEAGCTGLMVLPPYLYSGTWREIHAHFSAVIDATPLSCMLYNNPAAYGVDVLAPQVAELAREHANLHAVKESSGDVRRITAIREEVGERLEILVGLDDLIVEGVAAGATGWIAGLVNALPEESVRLFELAAAGPSPELDALYQWFLPLLRMDTTRDFVQLIKLVQAATGHVGGGGPCVRAPRLLPEGAELARVQAVISKALSARPARAAAAGRRT